jgi:hypothetical protein
MTQEEFLRMKNLLSTVIEQQATFAENQLKAEERMTRGEARMTHNEEAIAALLTVAEVHEHERVEADKRINARFAETDERINALINVGRKIYHEGFMTDFQFQLMLTNSWPQL